MFQTSSSAKVSVKLKFLQDKSYIYIYEFTAFESYMAVRVARSYLLNVIQ